jgi:hypothetical protein
MTSNSGRRLDRLFTALTPKERAILVLRAWKAGREPNRQLLTSTSQQEAHEYNRLVDLLQIATGDLTQYLVCIHLLAGQLEIRLSWYLTVLLWGNSTFPNERAEEIGEALLNGLVEGIGMRWRELGALDVLLAEIAEEVDGEDVLHPEAREVYDRTREQLQALHASVTRYGGTCELQEPTVEDVEALRARVKGVEP